MPKGLLKRRDEGVEPVLEGLEVALAVRRDVQDPLLGLLRSFKSSERQ